MNVLVIYYKQNPVNYNKLLIVDTLRSYSKMLNDNNITIEFIEFEDINLFIDEFEISKYKNYILWLHQKIGSYIVTLPDKLKLIKEYNIKTIFWIDDLHYPTVNTSNEERLHKELVDKDERYLNVDLILTPSLDYFENIDSNLLSKSKFLFYFFDINLIDKFNPINYDNRINKILLTGKINLLSYPSRKQMYTNYFYNKDLYDWIDHPGYKNYKHNVFHLNYYNKLSEYKGAILGLAKYPVNFLLAKVVEILGCGCLGFFEESSLYEERLGLKEYVHYIPVEIKNNDDIEVKYSKENFFYLDIDNSKFESYLNSDKGKEIAKNGYNYIKEKLTSDNFINKIISIINNI